MRQKLPVRFEANRGQVDPRVRYMLRQPNSTTFLTPSGVVWRLGNSSDQSSPGSGDAARPSRDGRDAVVRMRFLGANPDPQIRAKDRRDGMTNYLVGEDPSAWRSEVPAYGKVRYTQVWSGIDVVFYGNNGRLEFDVSLAPGADPGDVALKFAGAEGVSIDGDGRLVVQTSAGPLRLAAATVYQPTPGGRQPVRGGYRIGRDGEVRFELGPYDPSRRLVIDPVVAYATTSMGGEAIAVDAGGHVYVAGRTDATTFPTTAEAFQEGDPDAASGNEADAFAAKLSEDGSRLLWATYLGGSGTDTVLDVDVGPDRRLYLVGSTSSDDLPTTGAYQGGRRCPEAVPGVTSPCPEDAFVAVLSPDGAALEYASYLGGKELDSAQSISVGADGAAIVAGVTRSPSFPTTDGAYDRRCGTGGQCNPRASGVGTIFQPGPPKRRSDGFVAKIDPDSSGNDSLLWSTFLGGGDREGDLRVHAPADAARPVAVVGATHSDDLFVRQRLTGGGFQTDRAGGIDAFAARLSSDGSELAYGTYLGGSADDDRAYLAVRPDGGLVVAGRTDSADFPVTVGAVQPERACSESSPDCAEDGFVAVIDPDVSGQESLVWSTYLGGRRRERIVGVAVDEDGFPVVAGRTSSRDDPNTGEVDEGFPTTGNVPDPTYQGGKWDVFVAKLKPDGTELDWATHLGGERGDESWGVTAGRTGVYVTGETTSVGDGGSFPVTSGAYQQSAWMAGNVRRFTVKLGRDRAAPPPTVTLITPATGLPRGGTEVTIRGASFIRIGQVRFGDKAARDFTVASPTEITATAPPHPPGLVHVTVTGARGTSRKRLPASTFVYGEGLWKQTGNDLGEGLETVRGTSVLLDGPPCEQGTPPGWCGKVLHAGTGTGPFGTAAVFNPRTGRWEDTGDLNLPRADHGIARLPDGRVLVAGGRTIEAATSHAEIYNPASGEWTLTTPMPAEVYNLTLTLLDGPGCGESCGKVLATGGCVGGGNCNHEEEVTPYAQLYDPETGTWTRTGGDPRYGRALEHTATRLDPPGCGGHCGKVLVVGGLSRGHVPGPQEEAPPELYDPATDAWTEITDQRVRRYRHAAIPLANGEVLVAGGKGTGNIAEVYDPDASGEEPTWRLLPDTIDSRARPAAAPLPGGRAMVFKGQRSDLTDIFDPRLSDGSGGWRWGARVPGRGSLVTAEIAEAATLLSADGDRFAADPAICGDNCGKVLVAGVRRLPPLLFTPAPTIQALQPTRLPAGKGGQVTISGAGFTFGVSQVRIGDTTVECPSEACQVHSFGRLTVTAPPHSQGEVEVAVVGASGTARAPDSLAYAGRPAAVSDLAAESLSGSEIRLSFSAVGDGTGAAATEYAVKQSRSPIEDASAFEQARTLCEGSCRFTPEAPGDRLVLSVTDLEPQTTYHYSVRAKGPQGLGPVSNPARATTARSTPGRVEDLAATSTSPSEITLSFSAVGDGTGAPASGYVVAQSTSPIGDASAFDQARNLCGGPCRFGPERIGAPLSLTVTDLRPATTYHYAVRAAGPGGTRGPLSTPAQATTPEVAAAPAAARGPVQRLAGPNRYATAVAVSRDLYPQEGSAGSVVVARGDGFADALTGIPLARARDAPLLLTRADLLPAPVRGELTRVLPLGSTVFLLGGQRAVSPAVEQRIRDLGYQVKRLGGPTRVQTALEVADAVGDPQAVLVTTGRGFADALPAGAAAARAGAVVVLSDGDRPHPSTSKYLGAHGDAPVFAIGGPAARAYPEARGVFGPSREHTAMAVARRFFDQPQATGLARRDGFADALAGAVHVAARRGPMLLTPRETLHPVAGQWLCQVGVDQATVYGGPAAVTAAVAQQVADRVSGRGCG